MSVVIDRSAPPDDTDYMTPIGRFVRQVREARHMSQAQLARRCGLSRAYINALEGGNVKDPSAKTLGIMARALGIDILEMLEASGAIVEGQRDQITSEAELATYLRRNRELSEPSVQGILRLIRLFEIGEKEGV